MIDSGMDWPWSLSPLAGVPDPALLINRQLALAAKV